MDLLLRLLRWPIMDFLWIFYRWCQVLCFFLLAIFIPVISTGCETKSKVLSISIHWIFCFLSYLVTLRVLVLVFGMTACLFLGAILYMNLLPLYFFEERLFIILFLQMTLISLIGTSYVMSLLINSNGFQLTTFKKIPRFLQGICFILHPLVNFYF